MAAQPKKKISRVRGRTRRAHSKISLPKLGKCINCGHLKPPHIACPECGFYGKKKIITTKTDKRIAKKLKTEQSDKAKDKDVEQKPPETTSTKPKESTSTEEEKDKK